MLETNLLKQLTIATIGGWLLSKIIPISPFLIFTVILVFCDLVTGIIAAKNRKEKITSFKIRRTVVKIVLYFIAILLAEGMRDIFIKQIFFS
jgi:hypothetical protein